VLNSSCIRVTSSRRSDGSWCIHIYISIYIYVYTFMCVCVRIKYILATARIFYTSRAQFMSLSIYLNYIHLYLFIFRYVGCANIYIPGVRVHESLHLSLHIYICKYVGCANIQIYQEVECTKLFTSSCIFVNAGM